MTEATNSPSPVLRPLHPADFDAVAALQRDAFPAPFPEELLWHLVHLQAHLERFPEGQFVAELEGVIVASCTNCIVSEETWQRHLPWEKSVVDLFLSGHDPAGTTLYGVDVTVHPEARGLGIAKAFYRKRFELVERAGLRRYGTVCRLPGFANVRRSHALTAEEYGESVARADLNDRTMTPLLRCGLRYEGIIHDYMEDEESENCAAILVWSPRS